MAAPAHNPRSLGGGGGGAGSGAHKTPDADAAALATAKAAKKKAKALKKALKKQKKANARKNGDGGQKTQPPPDPNPTATLLAELNASRAAADTPMVSLSAAEVAALRAKAQELDSLERNAAAAEDRSCCSICLEPYAGEPAAALKLPRVLPCGHSFCEGCITQILRKLPAANEEAHKTITCPKCRDAVAVPRGQAQRLPTNYDLID